MFAALKNGQLAKRKFIYFRYLKVCRQFLLALWEEGYISGFKIEDAFGPFKHGRFKIFLKYYKDGRPVIKTLKAVSPPGRKFYLSVKQIWKIDSGRVFVILSTNQGLKSVLDCKRLKIGGRPFIVID